MNVVSRRRWVRLIPGNAKPGLQIDTTHGPELEVAVRQVLPPFWRKADTETGGNEPQQREGVASCSDVTGERVGLELHPSALTADRFVVRRSAQSPDGPKVRACSEPYNRRHVPEDRKSIVQTKYSRLLIQVRFTGLLVESNRVYITVERTAGSVWFSSLFFKERPNLGVGSG